MATIVRAPTGDQSTSGAIGYSSGTTGYNLVNDHPDTADPLTSYVAIGTTANSYIMFTYAALNCPTDCTVDSVAVAYTDEEPSTGTNSSCAQLRVGTTMYANATTFAPSTTTATHTNTWTTNPATSSAWTPDQINNVGGTGLNAFGVKGPDSNPVFRVGSVQLTVTYTLAPVTRSTDVGGLVLTGSAPTVFLADPKVANPDVGALTLTGNAPTAVNSERLRVSWVDLEIPEQDPVAITAGLGALSLTGYEPTSLADGPIAVAAGFGELALAGLVPTVQQAGTPISVESGFGELAFAGLVPTVAGSERLRVSWVDLEIPTQDPVAISAGVGELAFGGLEPTAGISGGTSPDITAGVGVLTLTGYEPTATSSGASVNIPTGLGALTLTGMTPDVRMPVWITAGLGAVAIDGQPPIVANSGETPRLRVSWVVLETPAGQGHSLFPDFGQLAFTGYVPVTSIGGASPNIKADSGALVVTGQVPAAFVTGTERLRVSWVDLETPAASSWQTYPGVGSLTITGHAPYINPNVVNPDFGALTLTGFAPEQTLTVPPPGAGTLTLTGQTPAVARTENQWITSGLGALTLDGKQPLPLLATPPNMNIGTDEGTLVIDGQTPNVRNDITIEAGLGALAITSEAPSLNAGIVVDVGTLEIAGLEPSLTRTEHTFHAPGYAELVIVGAEPTTMHGGAWSVASGLGQLRLTGLSPECRNSGDFPVQEGGGWAPLWDYPRRRRTPKEVEEDRIKFGVLPKPVQKALSRAANLVVRKVATEDDAATLEQQIIDRHRIAQVEAAVRAEMERAKLRWRASYQYVVQALILQALQQEHERYLEAERLRVRQEYEAQEAAELAEIAEIFLNWL